MWCIIKTKEPSRLNKDRKITVSYYTGWLKNADRSFSHFFVVDDNWWHYEWLELVLSNKTAYVKHLRNRKSNSTSYWWQPNLWRTFLKHLNHNIENYYFWKRESTTQKLFLRAKHLLLGHNCIKNTHTKRWKSVNANKLSKYCVYMQTDFFTAPRWAP